MIKLTTHYLGLIFLVLSLLVFITINSIHVQGEEIPRIIRPPLERELCERIPLGETLEKHQQFQEEIFKYLMDQKTKARTVFLDGLKLADMAEECDSKFLDANFDCMSIAPSKTITVTRTVHVPQGPCCARAAGVCVWRQNHVIGAFRENNIVCPGGTTVTSQEFLLGFGYDRVGFRVRRGRRVTSNKTITVQGCGEFIRPGDVTDAMWRKIRDKMVEDRVRDMCRGASYLCPDPRILWRLRCSILRDVERFITRIFLDMQFKRAGGLWVGYHCTKCVPAPNYCTGDPCPRGTANINSLLNDTVKNGTIIKKGIIRENARISREQLIKIQMFERALIELAGRFDTIRQSFGIWQRTRVGSLESCFLAKDRGRIDLCIHKLDYYVCK